MKTAGEKSIIAPVSINAFWATITDYHAYPQIIDDIKAATIVERRGNIVVVAFHLRIFLKSFDYTLRMVEDGPHSLTWTLVESKTLRQNDGGWRLEVVSPNETRVTYWNELAAKAFLPKAFINALARVALPSMLKRWSSYAQRHHQTL